MIELADVKPGDFGSAVFDFALCDSPGFVWLRGRLRAASENGVTEPEADSDEEEDGVELLDAARAAVWVDDGDRIQDGNESLVASGTLRRVLNAVAAGEGLGLPGDEDAEEFGGEGRNCFSSETAHSVVFVWRVPVDVGNQIQSDRVEFDLGFYTEQCRHNAASSSGLGYLPQSKLAAESGDEDDEYGRAVAVDGDTAMVGAPNGSVFVLERDGDEWVQTQVLESGDDGDGFGTTIDIDGDTALISAPGADSACIYTRSSEGSSGDGGADDGGSDAGDGTDGWAGSESQQLVATDGRADDKFGSGVALGASGGTAFVGAREGDGAETDTGAVYVFTT